MLEVVGFTPWQMDIDSRRVWMSPLVPVTSSLSTISFLVKVPVLSLKRYYKAPSSSGIILLRMIQPGITLPKLLDMTLLAISSMVRSAMEHSVEVRIR